MLKSEESSKLLHMWTLEMYEDPLICFDPHHAIQHLRGKKRTGYQMFPGDPVLCFYSDIAEMINCCPGSSSSHLSRRYDAFQLIRVLSFVSYIYKYSFSCVYTYSFSCVREVKALFFYIAGGCCFLFWNIVIFILGILSDLLRHINDSHELKVPHSFKSWFLSFIICIASGVDKLLRILAVANLIETSWCKSCFEVCLW